MDQQNKQDQIHGGLTRKIIGEAFGAINKLGSGFLKSVYEKAFTLALTQAGLTVESQKQIEVTFRGQNIGNLYADLEMENEVLIELKAVKAILPEH